MAESKDQVANFEKVAKSLGCDDDEERFNATLGKIARQKPTEKSSKPETKEPGQ